MKRIFLFLMVLLMIASSISCSKNNDTSSNRMYISLRHNKNEQKAQSFDWYVENHAEENNSLTFKKGNIIHYKITNNISGKAYIKEDTDDSNIILKKGDQYKKNIVINSMKKGHYQAEFWATSEEGIQGKMIIDFDVE